MKRSRRILVLSLATLLALVLCDVGISVFVIRDGLFLGQPLPPYGPITHPRQEAWLQGIKNDKKNNIGRFDAELGWSWKPSSATEDGRFHINSIGARGTREYPPAPPAGVTRIASFGDSFTFGDEVPDESTYQWIFEQDHPDCEAMNFGVSGYGTDQALLRYRRLGPGLEADVICIGILLENIGRNVNRYRPLWSITTGFCAAKPRFILSPSGELELVPQPFPTRDDLITALESGTVFDRIREHEHWLGRPEVPTGKLSSLVRLGAAVWVHWERSPERLWLRPQGEPFQVTLAILETFHREALAQGAERAVVLVFPAREDLRDHVEQGLVYWNLFYEELEKRNIDYIDLISPLARKYRELGEQAGSIYYGGHLSNVGNAVVAGELGEWLAGER